VLKTENRFFEPLKFNFKFSICYPSKNEIARENIEGSSDYSFPGFNSAQSQRIIIHHIIFYEGN